MYDIYKALNLDYWKILCNSVQKDQKMASTESPELRSHGNTFFRTTLVPLLLMVISPPAVQFVWVTCYYHDGNISSALFTNPLTLFSQFPSPSVTAGSLVVSFLIVQLCLLLLIPGPVFTAIPTPMGNRPTYRLNGVACFIITHSGLLLASRYGLIQYSMLYDHFGSVLAFLNWNALVMTVLLYFRGIYFPTNSDSGTTGFGMVWDMWHGTELHPEIFGMSLKQLINCRFAMMGWSVAIMSFAAKQMQRDGTVSNSMLVSTSLQMIYIFKFFLWESGYFNSVDIIHDRFGFYIFWGCSAFLPSIYTLTSYYLASHPVNLDARVAGLILIIGCASVGCNYWTDRQRQYFRATRGLKPIWGRPPEMIEAIYTTGDGKQRRSILLASGWWGVARHVNYVFELLLALCWSIVAGFGAAMPYVYFLFLTVLLVDRAYRDEIRCSSKYGKYYEEYCRMVPWKMIPGIY